MSSFIFSEKKGVSECVMLLLDFSISEEISLNLKSLELKEYELKMIKI